MKALHNYNIITRSLLMLAITLYGMMEQNVWKIRQLIEEKSDDAIM